MSFQFYIKECQYCLDHFPYFTISQRLDREGVPTWLILDSRKLVETSLKKDIFVFEVSLPKDSNYYCEQCKISNCQHVAFLCCQRLGYIHYSNGDLYNPQIKDNEDELFCHEVLNDISMPTTPPSPPQINRSKRFSSPEMSPLNLFLSSLNQNDDIFFLDHDEFVLEGEEEF